MDDSCIFSSPSQTMNPACSARRPNWRMTCFLAHLALLVSLPDEPMITQSRVAPVLCASSANHWPMSVSCVPLMMERTIPADTHTTIFTTPQAPASTCSDSHAASMRTAGFLLCFSSLVFFFVAFFDSSTLALPCLIELPPLTTRNSPVAACNDPMTLAHRPPLFHKILFYAFSRSLTQLIAFLSSLRLQTICHLILLLCRDNLATQTPTSCIYGLNPQLPATPIIHPSSSDLPLVWSESDNC